MRYRMSVIYGHPVYCCYQALHFSDHVTKKNERMLLPILGVVDRLGSSVITAMAACM